MLRRTKTSFARQSFIELPGVFYLPAVREEPEPSFLAARFSLRRSLRVFCGFCFCCFFGLSELLLMGATNDRRFGRALGSENGRERRQPPRSP